MVMWYTYIIIIYTIVHIYVILFYSLNIFELFWYITTLIWVRPTGHGDWRPIKRAMFAHRYGLGLKHSLLAVWQSFTLQQSLRLATCDCWSCNVMYSSCCQQTFSLQFCLLTEFSGMCYISGMCDILCTVHKIEQDECLVAHPTNRK